MRRIKLSREMRLAYLTRIALSHLYKFQTKSAMTRHFKLQAALWELRQ